MDAIALSPLTLERMRADVAEILGERPDNLRDDDNLIDLGLDSVRAMALVQRWRVAGARIELSEFIEAPSLAGWWSIVSRGL